MRKLVTIVLFVIVQISFAQNFKFGKVSKEELQETSYMSNEDVNAAVLYREEFITFEFVANEGFVQKKNIFERIKIYNKQGFDYATKSLRYYDSDSRNSETISALKAVTYNLENEKIQKTKLKSNGIFKEKKNKYWKTQKFTMPNLKEGCIVEYKYTLTSPFLRVDEIYLQQTIPIKKLDFKFEAPEYYNYKKHINPQANYLPLISDEVISKSITFSSREQAGMGGSGTTRSQKQESKESVRYKVVKANLVNIPALKQEPMVSNINDYRSKLVLEIDFLKYPNKPIKQLSTTWEAVANTIYENEAFGGQLNKTNFYKDEIDALIANSNDNLEKAGLIFNFLKSKVKWNGFVGIYSESGVRKAYKNQTGSNADINLLLTSMLRYAGLNANPVLVSTKENGVPLFPTRDGFDYVVSAIEMPNGLILLDASSTFSSPNILPTRALNWQGRMIKEGGSSTWVNLLPSKPSKHKVFMNYTINDDISISGKIRNQLTDHYAYKFSSNFFNASDESIIDVLQEKSPELVVSDLDIKNMSNSKPILQSYSFTLDNALDKIGDDIYISPMLFLVSRESPFKQETRNYPIDFNHPFINEYMINISIPEGYKIESLPENKAVKLDENNVSKYTYLLNESGNNIQLKVSFNFNYSAVPSAEYPTFRQYYNSYIEKLSDKIVLKKI